MSFLFVRKITKLDLEKRRRRFEENHRLYSILWHIFCQFYHHYFYWINTQFTLFNIHYHQNYYWGWAFFQFFFAYSPSFPFSSQCRIAYMNRERERREEGRVFV
jgi:hypothetical protein